MACLVSKLVWHWCVSETQNHHLLHMHLHQCNLLYRQTGPRSLIGPLSGPNFAIQTAKIDQS